METEKKLTDFEKLMILLKVDPKEWEELFYELAITKNETLVLDFNKNGEIGWGTLN